MATYKIAFSKHTYAKKIQHGELDAWKELCKSYDNLDLQVLDIANLIYTGHPYTAWHKNNWKHGDNYILSQVLSLDFDKEDASSRIDTLCSDVFVRKYAGIIYTTPSHTPNTPRARVMFMLDTPIMQAKNFTLATTAMMWLYGTADASCKDPCRGYWGSVNCDLQFYTENVLPLEKVKDIISQYLASGVQERQAQVQRIVGSCKDVSGMLKYVSQAQKGERNNILFWAANKARAMWDEGLIDDKNQVEDALIDAGIVAGLPEREAMWTVRRVLQ